jgi:3-oxoacyl-(acyl-carrier-protein) synthase
MTDLQPCVITGIGVAMTAGCDLKKFWTTLTKLGASELPRQIDDHLLNDELTDKARRKLDRSSLMALVAGRSTIADANGISNNCTGLLIGNSTGGWTYGEATLANMYSRGMKAISPHFITAWFPLAAQGQLSIDKQLRRGSKTVCAGRISAGVALRLALRDLRLKRTEAMLIGGTESPLSNLIMRTYQESGSSLPLAEGAAMLMVEAKETAMARGAKIYAEVAAMGRGTSLAWALRDCLHQGGVQPEQLDYLVLDNEYEKEEYEALREVFASHPTLVMSCPKSHYGELLGASMAANLVVACLSLFHQTVVPTAARLENVPYPPFAKYIFGAAQKQKLERVLIYGQDTDGQSLAVLLAIPTQP